MTSTRKGAARRRVLLVGDGANARVRKAVDELSPWIAERATVAGVRLDPGEPLDAAGANLVLVFGGDGAILSAADRLNGSSAPCIGIRIGHFGFLAELEPAACRTYLERIFRGEGRVVERLMLQVEARRGARAIGAGRALNDAVVTGRGPSRMVTLELEVDGEHVAAYRGDGLIVSTPVGSTAHSLAAGGPVVEPDANSILVTPLAPHTLSSRPLVLDAGRRMSVRLAGHRHRSAIAVLDGQRTVALQRGDELVIRRTKKPFRMLTVVERSFFATLREKLQWSGSVALDEGAG